MKHAYLILAHTEFQLLQILVERLDDSRNDIYVHFDLKVKELPTIQVEKAGLYILTNRVDVRWGDWSVVQGEFALFEDALKNGPYAYYHLLSGVDLPIKSQDYIHAFFNEHAGKEFIGYTLTELTPEIVRKVQRWHLFPQEFRHTPLWKRILRASYLRIQETLNIKRNTDIDFKKGSQWMSVTESMARYFMEHKDWAKKVFTHTFCSDEMVMQTLCWMSPYRDNIYNTRNDGKGCMRAIGWQGSTLVDWSTKDYDALACSEALFARKFNLKDADFIQKIVALSK